MCCIRLADCSVGSLLFLLLHFSRLENDEHTSEHSDEVDEEINAVGHVVLVSLLHLLQDQLGVVQDEPAHDDQSQVQRHVKQQFGSEEQVSEGERDESGEHGHETASDVDPLPLPREYGGQSERHEEKSGQHQGGHDDGRVDDNGHLQQRPESNACAQGETNESSHSISVTSCLILC